MPRARRQSEVRGWCWLLWAVVLLAMPAWAQQAIPEEQLERYVGRPVSRIELVRLTVEDGNLVRSTFDSVTEQRYRNQIRTLRGQPFRIDTVRQDENNLFRLGEFESFTIELESLSDQSVIVRYVLMPQPIIRDVQITGNRRMRLKRITDLPEVELLAGTPVDRQRVAEAAAAIEDLYKERGYYRAVVTVDEQELVDNDIVLFRVREGSRTRVTDVRFDFGGRGSFTPKQLRPEITTRVHVPLIEKAPLDDTVLRADVDSLTNFYLDRGFLDVEVDYYVRPSPDNSEAIVTFLIHEGRIYSLRSIRVHYPDYELPGVYTSVDEAMAEAPMALVHARIQRATGLFDDEYPDDPEFVRQVLEIFALPEADISLDEALAQAAEVVSIEVGVHVTNVGEVRLFEHGLFSPKQIAGLMAIKAGDVYSARKVTNSVNSLTDAYGRVGYIIERRLGEDAVRIQTTRFVDPERPEVDLFIEIFETERYRTGEVIIRRNTITRQEVILRDTEVRPDRPLNAAAIRRSTDRLTNRRLFAPGSVRITPQRPDPADPEYRDVLIEVEETDTGEFNLGGSIGSDLGVTGFLNIRQRNFDITDTPDSAGEFFANESFRGDGQTFDLTLAPGTVTQTYSVSLTEPALFESDYSLGGRLFYLTNDFSQYNEERYGTSFTLARRFGTQWVGSASLRIESVALSDVSPDEPVDILEVADRNLVNSIGLGLARTTVPGSQRFRPTEGSRTEISVEQFGLLGDFSFTRLNVEHLTFLTVREDFFGRRTVLTLRSRTAWIPQGQDEAPTYERFYLGGRSFRGFEFRSVSPVGVNSMGQVTDVQVGGTWLLFLGAEIEQPIVGDMISLVAFVDTGTVTEEIGFDDYRVSVGAGARIFVPFLSQAPLAFDFGFPLIKADTDETRLFTFSIDIEY